MPVRGEVWDLNMFTYQAAIPLPERQTFNPRSKDPDKRARPGIVVSADHFNEALLSVTMVPLTDYLDRERDVKARLWTLPIRRADVIDGKGLKYDSLICCSEPWTIPIDSTLLLSRRGRVEPDALSAVEYLLRRLFRAPTQAYDSDLSPGDTIFIRNGSTDVPAMVVSASMVNYGHSRRRGLSLATVVRLFDEDDIVRQGTFQSAIPVEICLSPVVEDGPTVRATAMTVAVYQVSTSRESAYPIRKFGSVSNQDMREVQKAISEYLALRRPAQ